MKINLKKSPIGKLFSMCKEFTVAIGKFLGIVLVALGIFAPNPISVLFFGLLGIFSYLFAGSLAESIEREKNLDKINVDDDWNGPYSPA